MAKVELTCHEYILSVFSTNVAVLCTHQVEVLSQKSRLSFVEILQSFSHLYLDAQIKDPLSNINNIQKFNLNFIEMKNQCVQPLIAKKLLNESVSKYVTIFNDDESLTTQNHDMHNMHNIYSQFQLKKGCATSDQKYHIEYPLSCPWFDDYCQTFFKVMLSGDHEYLRHFIACIFVVSTNVPNPLVELEGLVKQQHEHQHQSQAGQNITSQQTAGQNITNITTTSSNAQSTSPLSTQTGSFHHHHRPSPAGASNSGNKWFCPNVFHFHVLLHDPAEMDDTKANFIYENMKNMYGSHSCHFLRINDDSTEMTPAPTDSAKNPQSLGNNLDARAQINDVENALVEAATSDISNNTDLSQHPLSNSCSDDGQECGPEKLDFPENVVRNFKESSFKHSDNSPGYAISHNDAKHIRNLLTEFCLKGLFPWAERQLRLWNEQLQSKKGIHKSLITATKKWFSSGRPPTSGTGQTSSTTSVLKLSLASLSFNLTLESILKIQNARAFVRYSSESPELQMRHLADLAFLFQCYPFAYSFYHSVKRDFQSDQAWVYYAGAVEMAAISAFMSGINVTNYPFHYMDSAINTYLSVCNLPMLATRATLISTEILKSLGLYADAAMQFVRLTTEESDLRSALFLEQSALCFAKIKNRPMLRKYGYHMVLAGNRYFKANPTTTSTAPFRTHGLRCYTLAWGVYRAPPRASWTLARDHVAYTLARHWLAAATLTCQASKLSSASTARCPELKRSLTYFKALFEARSSQSAALQTNFFKEFTAAYNEIKISQPDYCFEMPIPYIDCQKVRISLPEYYDGISTSRGVSTESKELEKFCYRSAIKDSNRDCPSYFSSHYDEFTPNDYPSNVFAREKFRIDLPIYNSYKIPLIVSNLRLIGHFSRNSESQSNSSPAQAHIYPSSFMTDAFQQQQMWDARIAEIKEQIYHPYTVDPAYNNFQEFVIVQPQEDIFISPLESKMVTFVLEPQAIGILKIDGVRYSLVFPFATSPATGYGNMPNGDINTKHATSYPNPGIDSFKSSISFRQTLWCHGRRLNDSITQHKNPTYSIDRRLEILVRPVLPYLKFKLEAFPSSLYDGQILEGSSMIGNLPSKSESILHNPAQNAEFGLIIATNNPLCMGLLRTLNSCAKGCTESVVGHNEVLYQQEQRVENFKLPLSIYNCPQARAAYENNKIAGTLLSECSLKNLVSDLPAPTQLKCDLLVMIYEKSLSHLNSIASINYRLHRFSLDIKSEPSLTISGVWNKSQNRLGNINALVNLENLTKETDDKIMEIHLQQIFLLNNSLTFSPCLPPSSKIPSDIRIKPSETLRMSFTGKAFQDVLSSAAKNIIFSEALTGKRVEGDSLAHCDYVSKLLKNLQELPTTAQVENIGKIIALIYWKGIIVDEKGGATIIQGLYPCTLRDLGTNSNVSRTREMPGCPELRLSNLLNYHLECPIVTVQSSRYTATPLNEDLFSYISFPPALVNLSLTVKNTSTQCALRISIRATNYPQQLGDAAVDDVDKYDPALETTVFQAIEAGTNAKSALKTTETLVGGDLNLPQPSGVIDHISPRVDQRGYLWVGTTDFNILLEPGQVKTVILKAFFPAGTPGAYQIKDLSMEIFPANQCPTIEGKSLGMICLGPASASLNKAITDSYFVQIEHDPANLRGLRGHTPEYVKKKGKIINV